MLKIESIEQLIHELNSLPSIGNKSAQRLSYAIVKNKQLSMRLRESLKAVEDKVKTCPTCFNFTDLEADCTFCLDFHRQKEIICVVEEPGDIEFIENSGVFKGMYHVLHGTLAPLEGVRPSDLKIAELIDRIGNSSPKIEEVIFALDTNLEGDTTVLYLTKMLADKKIKISRLAHGVPMGSDIGYLDNRTLGQALQNRVEL